MTQANTQITLTFNAASRQAAIARLDGINRSFTPILVSAINDTLRVGKNLMARRVREQIAIKQGDAEKLLRTDLASKAKPVGVLRADRRGVPLKYFGAKEVTRTRKGKRLVVGVRVKVRKNEPSEVIPHAFIARNTQGGKNLGEHIFTRWRKSGRNFIYVPGRRVKRKMNTTELPIQKLWGPTLVGVIAGYPGMLQSILDDMSTRLQARIESKLAYALNAAASKIGQAP